MRAAVAVLALIALCCASEACLFIDRFDHVKTPDTTALRFEEALRGAVAALSPLRVVAFQDSAKVLRARGVTETELCADVACIARRAQQLLCSRVIGGRIQTVKQNVRVWAVLVDVTTGKALREVELEFPESLPSSAAAEVAQLLFSPDSPSSKDSPTSRQVIHDKRKERRNLFVGLLVGTVATGLGVAIIVQIATSKPEKETVDFAVEW
jgi:hypothetical protein